MQLIEDEDYRNKVTKHLQNHGAYLYFNRTLEQYRSSEFAQKSSSTSNKIFQIVANPVIANIFGQYHPSIDFAEAINNRKILLFDVSQSAVGEHFCQLICALVASEIITTAMSRPPEQEHDEFMLYIDEFQKAHSRIFNTALSEARKHALCLTLSNQFIDQLDPTITDAVFGNVGTSIMFRVSGKDAEKLATYDPEFPASRYRGLGTGQAVTRAMVDGAPTTLMEIKTTPLPVYSERRGQRIKNVSRYRYGRTRAKVEKRIARELGVPDHAVEMEKERDGDAVMRKQRRDIHRLVKKKRRERKVARK